MHKRGFTVIELIVVAAIVTIISALILANNTKYGARVLLQNLAYSIALSVRQAQVYGISVHSAGANIFNVGQGIHFDSNASTYYTFADTSPTNGVYDSGEEVKTMSIGNGFKVSTLCIGSPVCANVTSINIIFIRPEPDAWINPTGCLAANPPTTSSETCLTSSAAAQITVLSPKGDTKKIIVSQNGQISVQ
jgi:prepilin-type N-terminal cleavage/methylation domain-containing protein